MSLRTMFTCPNLDCDYYNRFLSRRRVLFLRYYKYRRYGNERDFQYKPVCPACVSEVLNTDYWDPTNYRRVFVNGHVNREVLPNKTPDFGKRLWDSSRLSRMINSVDLHKLLNLDISDHFTQCLATVAFEYNLEIDLEDLRKICIINTAIRSYNSIWLNKSRFKQKISNLNDQIDHLASQIRSSSFSFKEENLFSDIKDKIFVLEGVLEGVKDEISYLENIPLCDHSKAKISHLYSCIFVNISKIPDLKDKISDFEDEISADFDATSLYARSRRKEQMSRFLHGIVDFFNDQISKFNDQISKFNRYYWFYEYYYFSESDHSDYDSIDKLISHIKESMSDYDHRDHGYLVFTEILECLTPNLIDLTQLNADDLARIHPPHFCGS